MDAGAYHSVATELLAMADPQPKVFEARFYDVAVFVHPDLELHDVAAGGGAHEAGADVWIVFVKAADITGPLIMLHHLNVNLWDD